jgi:uncharacterized protein (DUF779 family)
MSVTATGAAVPALTRLRAAHGPLTLHESGGCCDGSSPICLQRGDLPVTPSDLLLGEVDGTPFYIDTELYERWGHPSFVLDVAPGAPEGFSLGLEDAHLIARTQPC